MDLINPRVLRAFMMLAEELHFGRAARRLGVSQSTVSEQLRSLEHDLDVVLFERHSRGVSLTEVGAELLEPAGRLVMDNERFVRQARSVADADEVFCLGAPAAAMRLVADVAAAAAAVDLRLTIRALTVVEGVRALARGELQAMLTGIADGLATPGIDQIVLAHSEVVVIMAPSHPLARLESIDRTQLIGHRVGVPVGFLAVAEELLADGAKLPELSEYTSFPHSIGELIGGDRVALNLFWYHQGWRDSGFVDRPLTPPIPGTMSMLHRSGLSSAALANVQKLAELARSCMPEA